MNRTRTISALALATALGWTAPASAQSAADFAKMRAQMEAMQTQLEIGRAHV